jgi:hypothetical protein
VLALAYSAHPERFVRGVPRPAAAPAAVWINPPKPAIDPLGKQIDLVESPQSHDLDLGKGARTPEQPGRGAALPLDAAAATLNSRDDCLILIDRLRRPRSLPAWLARASPSFLSEKGEKSGLGSAA